MNKINHRTHKLKKKMLGWYIIICYSGLSAIYQIEIYLNLLFYDYCSLQWKFYIYDYSNTCVLSLYTNT